jgi:hypothetical protein
MKLEKLPVLRGGSMVRFADEGMIKLDITGENKNK